MNEIWHTTGEPGYSTPIIVINPQNEIIDFGFYRSGVIDINPGDKWAYMTDLVEETINKDKQLRI